MSVKLIEGNKENFTNALQEAVEDGYEVKNFNTIHVHPDQWYDHRYFHYSAIVVKP